MMWCREWAAEGSTGLTIGHKRVCKEQAGLCCEAIGNLTGLAHEAVLHLHRVINRATITDNRVLADHASTNEYRRILTTQNRTLVQAGTTANLAVALNHGVDDILGIDNLHTITYDTALGCRDTYLVVNQLAQAVYQGLIVIILHHERSQLRVQFTEEHNITIAHLIEYTDRWSCTIAGPLARLKRRDIRDITVITDGIIVDEVAHFLNQAVITHGYISQCGIVDTRMFEEALSHLDFLLELTQADIAIEHYTVEVVRTKILVNQYSVPILCPAYIVFKYLDLLLCQLSVLSHNCLCVRFKFLYLLLSPFIFFYLLNIIQEVIIRIFLHM